MEFDATFWAFIALLIFIGLLVWLKVPAAINKTLDDRADKIRDELEEARRLREEAQELLAEYQLKRRQAETEAEEVISAARHEAELLARDAEQKTKEFIERRTAMAQDKIAQAEAQAVLDVKASAVDLAVAAAEKIIGAKLTGDAAGKYLKQSIAEMKSRLN